MTATDHAGMADIAEAEQPEKMIYEDTIIYAVEQRPFITFCNKADERMHSLDPPKDLIRDWNNEIVNNTVIGTFEEIEFAKRYISHIKFSPAAEEDLKKIKMKLLNNDVCIVSGGRTYPFCVRRLIYEYITGNEVILQQ